jgi:hypothetical protein
MTKTLDDFTGAYGSSWRTGVLVDHLGTALEAGMLAHASPRGYAYVTGPKGGHSVPVLCGEIVEIWTEDGPTDGRCGCLVKAGEGACPGHWAGILSWRNASEYERCAIERKEEMDR